MPTLRAANPAATQTPRTVLRAGGDPNAHRAGGAAGQHRQHAVRFPSSREGNDLKCNIKSAPAAS